MSVEKPDFSSSEESKPEPEPKEGIITEKNIRLISPEEFEKLPDGTELYSIVGKKVIKGVDEISQDTRNGSLSCGLKYDPESLKPKELKIWLITPDQLNALPDGTELISINGRKVIKGSKEANQETAGGYLPFGFTDETKPGDLVFKNESLYDTNKPANDDKSGGGKFSQLPPREPWEDEGDIF